MTPKPYLENKKKKFKTQTLGTNFKGKVDQKWKKPSSKSAISANIYFNSGKNGETGSKTGKIGIKKDFRPEIFKMYLY